LKKNRPGVVSNGVVKKKVRGGPRRRLLGGRGTDTSEFDQRWGHKKGLAGLSRVRDLTPCFGVVLVRQGREQREGVNNQGELEQWENGVRG